MRARAYRILLALMAIMALCACSSSSVLDELSGGVSLAKDGYFCSGIAIAPHLVLSAAHCEHMQTGAIEYPQHQVFKVLGVVKTDKVNDLVLYKTDGVFVPVPILQTGEYPRVGDQIRVVGCPAGHCNTITTGYIASLDDEGFVRFSAPIFFGASGGGVYWQGKAGWELISVNHAIYAAGSPIGLVLVPGVSYGTKPDAVRAFLE